MRIKEIESNEKCRRRTIPKLDIFFSNLPNFENLIINKILKFCQFREFSNFHS